MGRGAGDLSKAIKKACSIEESAPKRKHVRACIVYTWDSHSSKEFFHLLKNSPYVDDSVQLFKMLTLIHKVIQEGHPSALIEGIRNRSWIKSLARVPSGGHGGGDMDGYDKLIRHYVGFLVEKLNFHAHHKGFRNGIFEYKEYISLISVNDLDQGYETILELMSLQDKVDHFSNFVFASIERGLNNDLKISSLVPLISESYGIYKFITSMVRAIYSQLDDDGVLDLLREKVEQQHLKLFEFYADCSSIKLLSTLVTIPKLPRDPPNLLAQLDAVPQTSESLSKPQEQFRSASPATHQPRSVSPQKPQRPQSSDQQLPQTQAQIPVATAQTGATLFQSTQQALPTTTIAPLVPMLTAAAFPQAAMMTGGSFVTSANTGGANMFLNMYDSATGGAAFNNTGGNSLTNVAAANNNYMNASLTGNTNISTPFASQQQMPTTTFGAQMTGGMMPTQATGGMVPAQMTGGILPAQMTGGIVPAQMTGSYNANVSNQMGGGFQQQMTGGMIPAQLTGSFQQQQQQMTGGMMPAQLTGSFQAQAQPMNNFNTTMQNQVTGGFNANASQLTGGGMSNVGGNSNSFVNLNTMQQTGLQNNPQFNQSSMQPNMGNNNMINQTQDNQKLLEQYDIELQKNEAKLASTTEELATKSKELKSVQERYDALSKLYSQLRQEHLRLLPRAQNSTPEETLDFVLQGAVNGLQATPSIQTISKHATDLATHMNNFIFSKNDFNNVVYAATIFSSAIMSLSSSVANSTDATQRDNVQRIAYQAQTYLNKLKSTTLAPLSTEGKSDAVINANIEMQRSLQLLQ